MLDSLPVIPETVEIYLENSEEKWTNEKYKIHYNQLIIFDTTLINDPSKVLDIRFRVFPFDFKQPARDLDSSLIAKTYQGDYIGFDYSPVENQTEKPGILSSGGLQYSGSFSRGIAFGNSQDLILNSAFNLQLSGKLGDDTEILAALTDENIPLQAEGNTQQLNEFDKIFVRIKRKKNSLLAGDYEIQNGDTHFMRYYKKLQGATFSNQSEVFKNGVLNTQASIAISRGKFARNIIPPQEGNQGPYNLQGNEGEQFIIILAGTEKVYLDGELLVRGVEEDYIIDYNRSEITFTNKKMIHLNRRIIVEFEYVDQSFQRSIYALNSDFSNDKFRVYFNLFSQQDSKNAVGDTELSDEEKFILRETGDNLDNALASGIDTLEEGFNPDAIQYTQIDTQYTVFNEMLNKADTFISNILVFSTDPDLAKYTARFSQVGQGNGNYRQTAAEGANGRVFQWIAPDPQTGQLQGDFEPIKRLAAPLKQQLYTLGTALKINENSSLKVETALSVFDLNRFSNKDNSDNVGTALFSEYQINRNLGRGRWNILGSAKYEFVQKDFRILNPYRNAEFNRDWNVPLLGNREPANEHIAKGGITLSRSDTFQLSYEFSGFFREALYNGTLHTYNARFRQNGYDLKIYGSLLDSETDVERTRFFRPRIDFSKEFQQLNNWTLGIYGEREKNERAAILSDTLNPTSFYWDLYRVYLQSPSGRNFNWNINYTGQHNFQPQGKSFFQSSKSDEINLNGFWNYKPGSQLKWNFSYRNLLVDNEELSHQKAMETYLGRIDYNFNAWRGALRFNTNYEIGSGQEAKTEFQFIKVNKGEGVFQWEPTPEFDLNGDGVPQLNEFVIAPFQDQANYVRIATFTNDFIPTNNVILNQSIRLKPRAIWQNQKGIKNVLSKWSTLSTLRVNRKVKRDGSVSQWNPFDLNIADTSLVNIASSIRNVLFFNQFNPVYGFQIGQFDNRNRNVLTTGFESRKTAEQFIRSRWNISSHLALELNLINGQKTSDSELFDNRDFDIDYQKVIPQLSYLPNQSVEATFSYEFQKADNSLPEAIATAKFHDLKMEVQYNKSQKTALNGSFSFVNINVTGETNPTLELALLEGLKQGKNYLWNLTINRQISDNIQLSLRYEGRKTGVSRTVHVGSAQVRATF